MDASTASTELQDDDPVNPETWEWLEQGKGGKQQIHSAEKRCMPQESGCSFHSCCVPCQRCHQARLNSCPDVPWKVRFSTCLLMWVLLAPEELPAIDDLTFSYENLEELLDPQASHRLRLQTVQARRPSLVRKLFSLFGLQPCWVFQAIRWVCPKKPTSHGSFFRFIFYWTQ